MHMRSGKGKKNKWKEINCERQDTEERRRNVERTRMKGKKKLRTYRSFKKELKIEKYLTAEEGKSQQRRVMMMLRGGSNDLRIERGRYEKREVEERMCQFCDSGEVEDEEHFLCKCKAWKEERERCMKKVKEHDGRRCDDFESLMCVRESEIEEEKREEERWYELMMEGVSEMREKRRKELGGG
jgi:hypothetical protein